MNKKEMLFYFKNYKFNSLLFKNFKSIFLVVFLPLACVCLGIYFNVKSEFSKNIIDANNNSLIRIKEITDTVQRNINTVGVNIASSNSILQFAKEEKWNTLDYYSAQNMLDIVKTLSVSLNEYIDSIYIYSLNNEYILANDNVVMKKDYFYDIDWISEHRERNEFENSWVTGRIGKGPNKRSSPYVSTTYTIPMDVNKKIEGLVIVNMSCRWLEELINNVHTEDIYNFFIIDGNGVILYSRDNTIIGKKFTDQTGYLLDSLQTPLIENLIDSQTINSIYSEDTNRYYISIISLNEYQHKINQLGWFIGGVILICLILAIIVSFIISSRVFQPIKDIIDIVEHPEQFYNRYKNNTFQRTSSNETKYIISSFLDSFSERQSMEEQLTTYMAQLKQSQATLLQAQINPHFLYNTMQTINFLTISLTRSDNDASRAICKLSNMFRIMMEIDSNITTIEQEINYCKAYIEIEMLRFRDEFEIVWQVTPEVLDYMIVKMTLQPVIENCIKHAFTKSNRKGIIIIYANNKENEIEWVVRDNGVGCNDTTLNYFKEVLSEEYRTVDKHIGIINVNQRIKLIFGKSYGVGISRNMLGGTDVKITIPKVKK